MKNILKFIFTLLIIFAFSILKVYALSVSENNLKITKGESKSIELSANSDKLLTSIEFTLVYTTYDIPANFIVNSKYTDSNPNGIKHKVAFQEPISGNITIGNILIKVVNNPKDLSGTINIHSAKGITSSGEIINLNSQSINIIIDEETTTNNNADTTNNGIDTNKNVLKEIKSDIVKIDLKKDVFDYQITIDNDVEKLDLEPITIDDTYKIEVSNQEIAKLEDNKINITITNNTGNKTIYTIKVNTIKDISTVKIDNSNFKEKNTNKGKWIILIIFFSVVLLIGFTITKKKK